MPASQSYSNKTAGQRNTISDPFRQDGSTYRTETVATLDANGKVVSSEIRLQRAVQGRGSTPDYPDVAVSRDGGKNWVTPGSGRGTNENQAITTANSSLSASEIRSLQPNGQLNKAALKSGTAAVKKAGGTNEQAAAAVNNTTNTKEEPQQTVDAKALGETIGTDTNTRNTSNTYGRLVYPEDLSFSSQDKIRFTILQYASRGLTIAAVTAGGGGGTSLSPREDAASRILGTIFLPIPGGISDTNSAGWGDDSMTAFDLAAADIALASVQQGLSAGVDKLGNLAGNLSSNGNTNNEAGQAVATAFAALATQGTAGKLLSRTQGAVLNPNLELLFTGPELRSFNFTFKMSARSQSEANMIVKIIRAFKQAMSVQKSKSQLFLKAPNTFLIEYLHKNESAHTRIGKIKECALQSMTTRYAPEGQYATYTDGTPVSYEIDLQFKELEPIYNDDYGKESNDIGF